MLGVAVKPEKKLGLINETPVKKESHLKTPVKQLPISFYPTQHKVIDLRGCNIKSYEVNKVSK